MKICFTSDWQLGAGADLGQGDHGPGSRFQDQVDVLDRIADLAIAESVGLVAMLGDAFERPRPQPQEILAVQAFVRKVTGAGIRCLFLLGNHDARGSALPSALEIFAGDGCVIALLPSMYPFEEEGVVLCALPWTPPGQIVAAMPDADRGDINDVAAQALVAGAKVLKMRCDVEHPGLVPILVGHWAISGAVLPTGLPSNMLREPVIPLEALTDSGFALAMFGHLHVAGMLASGPTPVGYAGTPCVMNWAEAELPHGVWIFDSGESALRFVEVTDNKRFVTLDPTFSETPEAGTGVLGMHLGGDGAPDLTGAVVRLRYTVTEEQARRIIPAKLRESLAVLGATKVILRPTIVREERARVAAMSDDLSESAALDLWLSSKGINGDRAAGLQAAHASFLERVRQA